MSLPVKVVVTPDEVVASRGDQRRRLPSTVTMRSAGIGIWGRRWAVEDGVEAPNGDQSFRFSIVASELEARPSLARSECLSWYFVALISPLATGFPKRKMDVSVQIPRELLAALAGVSVTTDPKQKDPLTYLKKALVRVARRVTVDAI